MKVLLMQMDHETSRERGMSGSIIAVGWEEEDRKRADY